MKVSMILAALSTFGFAMAIPATAEAEIAPEGEGLPRVRYFARPVFLPRDLTAVQYCYNNGYRARHDSKCQPDAVASS